METKSVKSLNCQILFVIAHYVMCMLNMLVFDGFQPDVFL